MKVGIVTITIGINYGNRLQNYALQEVLRKLGVESHTFENIYQEKNFLKQLKRTKTLKNKEKIYKLKLDKFKEFNDKYINMNGKIKSFHVPKKLNKKYDYFICGSDQIWNPLYIGNTGTNFLTFAENHKKIAYAPSFGISYIPDDRKKEFTNYISNIKHLSCREIVGVKMIKELTGREAKLVLDPTLLLNSEDWDKIAIKCKFMPSRKYIVTYFLGNQTKEYKKYVKETALKNKFEIFDIMDESNMEKFSTNPCEFVSLIKNAEIVCTDSFHGTVFSILYKKPVINFNRVSGMGNMNSRINSLYKLLGIHDRNYTNVDEKNMFNIDYEAVHKKLENEKEKSINYLRKSLNIGDNNGNM